MTNYTSEYKMAAVELTDEIGLRPAAAELGISYHTLANWRRDRKAGKLPAHTPLPINRLLPRVRELEQEVETLRRTNKLLLEALSLSNGGGNQGSPAAEVQTI